MISTQRATEAYMTAVHQVPVPSNSRPFAQIKLMSIATKTIAAYAASTCSNKAGQCSLSVEK